jgi:hypothetical protein
METSGKAVIFFNLPVDEKRRLERYCYETRQSQTQVLREFIRSLPDVKEAKDSSVDT